MVSEFILSRILESFESSLVTSSTELRLIGWLILFWWIPVHRGLAGQQAMQGSRFADVDDRYLSAADSCCMSWTDWTGVILRSDASLCPGSRRQ